MGVAQPIPIPHPPSPYGVVYFRISQSCGKEREMDRKIRVLVAKPGLDGHDRGAKVIARALRDAGMEVIYTGLQQTPPMIVEAALQEDVDVIGLSILSGAHMTLLPKITQLLHDQGMDDVLVVAGGIISDADARTLMQQHGVAAVYGPGASTRDIVRYIQENVGTRKA